MAVVIEFPPDTFSSYFGYKGMCMVAEPSCDCRIDDWYSCDLHGHDCGDNGVAVVDACTNHFEGLSSLDRNGHCIDDMLSDADVEGSNIELVAVQMDNIDPDDDCTSWAKVVGNILDVGFDDEFGVGVDVAK